MMNNGYFFGAFTLMIAVSVGMLAIFIYAVQNDNISINIDKNPELVSSYNNCVADKSELSKELNTCNKYCSKDNSSNTNIWIVFALVGAGIYIYALYFNSKEGKKIEQKNKELKEREEILNLRENVLTKRRR